MRTSILFNYQFGLLIEVGRNVLRHWYVSIELPFCSIVVWFDPEILNEDKNTRPKEGEMKP